MTRCCQVRTRVQRVGKVSDKIPVRITRLLRQQDAKALQDLRKHASSIVEDSDVIATECRTIVREYNDLIEDVHAGKYTEAVKVLNGMIHESEEIVKRVEDMDQQAKAVKASLPWLFAVLSAVLWRLR